MPEPVGAATTRESSEFNATSKQPLWTRLKCGYGKSLRSATGRTVVGTSALGTVALGTGALKTINYYKARQTAGGGRYYA